MLSSSNHSRTSSTPKVLSPTRIGRALSCPASYGYYLKWRLREEYRDDDNVGSVVHDLIEHGKYPTNKHDDLVGLHHGKLMKVVESLNIEIIETEVEQIFQVADGVLTHRIIDALCYWHEWKIPILVDWKTAYKKWEVLPGDSDVLVAPQAMGFQATGYLLQPPMDDELADLLNSLGTDRWPEKMLFIVSPIRGGAQYFEYDRSDDDEKNYLEAVEMIRDYEKYPKNRGRSCEWCDFQPKCFGVLGEEEMYEPKDRRIRRRKG